MLLRTSLIIIFAICLVNMYFFFLTFLNKKSIIYAPRCFRIQIRIKRSALLNIRRKKNRCILNVAPPFSLVAYTASQLYFCYVSAQPHKSVLEHRHRYIYFIYESVRSSCPELSSIGASQFIDITMFD